VVRQREVAPGDIGTHVLYALLHGIDAVGKRIGFLPPLIRPLHQLDVDGHTAPPLRRTGVRLALVLHPARAEWNPFVEEEKGRTPFRGPPMKSGPISGILSSAEAEGRPSLWDRRYRRPRAADPGASSGQLAPCLALLRAGLAEPRRSPIAREGYERVRARVRLAPHVLVRDPVEASSQLDRFLVKLLQPQVLDLVATGKLLDQKLGIGPHVHGAHADLRHTSQARDHSAV